MIRLLLDPGVLVSAAITPSGAPAQLLQAIREGVADIIALPKVIEELHSVLMRPRFRRYLSLEQAEDYVRLITRLAIRHDDPPDAPRITRDPDDDYLFSLGRAARVVAIVSGDKDVTSLKRTTPLVLTPRQAFDRLSQRRPITGR